MHVLITAADCRLARAVMAALPSEARIRALDARFTADLPAGVERREGDLRDSAFVAGAMEGISAVLHLAAMEPQSANPTEALDVATRGTYVLATEALNAGVQRFVLGSTLALFDRLPAHWKVTEIWRPRPEPVIEHLCPYLAELSARESFRVGPLRPLCLRFGQIVDDEQAATQPYDSRRVHLNDALTAIKSALTFDLDAGRQRHANWIAHITAAGPRAKIRVGDPAFSYAPEHEFAPPENTGDAESSGDWKKLLAPRKPIPSRPVRKVVVFGAGGPVFAAATGELAPSYRLRLTDVRPLEDIVAENKPQNEGSPLPPLLDAPHERRVVDVSDAKSVLEACEGMDAIINCTVVRPDPAQAFRVNTLGAFHIMQAAVAHNIRRVVQTGPAQNLLQDEDGYFWDFEIPEALPRPGHQLYFHTKFLGQELCRIFAEAYGLEVPMLQYCQFLNPEVQTGVHYFAVSWADSARALRRALEARSYPLPYEVFNITADLPHGKYANHRAKEVLDWEPRDSMEHLWQEGV